MDFLKIPLFPFSLLYGLVISLRNLFFDIGIFESIKVNAPVISVGNLTAGGTGKTPLVEYILEFLLKQNKRAAVVSRGYKRTTRGTLVVSDGERLLSNAEACGDEPFQIARKFPNAIVIVDEQKSRSALLAVQKYNCNYIIVDDGFQHRKLYRDLDIVLVDASKPLNRELMLPAGLKREPIWNLKRADIIIYSNWKQKSDTLKNTSAKLTARTMLEARKLTGIQANDMLELEVLKNKTCVAFCGIGNPDSFERTLNELGLDVKIFKKYSDHYQYEAEDIEILKKEFEEQKTDFVITTEKDFSRLINMKAQINELPLYYLQVAVRFISGEEDFQKKITNVRMNN